MAFQKLRRPRFVSSTAALCALAAALFTAAPGLAQTEPGQETQPPARSPEYEQNVKGLAQVMGGLHYLRATCGDANDQTWRLNMQSLLDREGIPGAPIRVGMINAFNDGYTENKSRYPTCNGAAKAAQKTLGQRGGMLSRALARSNY